MRDHIKKKLCNGIAAVANNLIDVCDKALRKLRCMFAWLDHEQVFIDEDKHFHPVFILFLKYVIENLPDKSKAQDIQVCRELHVEGFVQKKETRGVGKRDLGGRTDIAVVRGPDPSNLLTWLFHVELKAPFAEGSLSSVKHQLIGQSEVIAQMKDEEMKDDQIKAGQMEDDYIKDGQMKDDQIKEGEMEGDYIKEGQKKEDQIRDGQMNDDKKKEGQMEDDYIKDGQMKDDQIKDGRMKDDQIKGGRMEEYMMEYRAPVLGCYTNLWKIVISLRLPGPSFGMFDRVFYNTAGVTESKEYCIRLLFLFCDLSSDDLVALATESTAQEVKVDDSQGPALESGNNASAGGRNDQLNSTTTFVDGGTSNNLLFKRFKRGDQQGNEARWQDLLAMNVREACDSEYSYLCKANLDILQRTFDRF